jgi:hypothetical protein
MKKIFIALFLTATGYYSLAQTNTFPPSGSAGIGTTSPLAKLHVVGGEIRLAGAGTSGIASGAVISFYDSNNATRYGYLGDASAGNSDIYLVAEAGGGLNFGTNANAARMVINTSGNVGIGTTTPTRPLDVNGWVQTNTGILFNNGKAWDVSSNGNDLYFDETGLVTRMTFLAGGNVGIGTRTPVALLNIAVPGSKATVAGNVVSFLSTNDISNPFGLRTMIYGASSINNRYVTLQTTDYSLADGGNLVLQSTIGNVAIGTTDTKGYKFAVNGSAVATSMTVKLNANWPDYVFKPGYQLPLLSDVKAYIDQNQHLPEMPSEADVARDGLNLGEVNKLLTKKVEELTLYLIQQKEETDKQLKAQQEQINGLEKKLDEITQ